MKTLEHSPRARVLLDGVELTEGDRNLTYGDPEINLSLQAALWDLYYGHCAGKYPPAHQAAMQHIFAKIARIACGSSGHRDNYVDLATYAAIAWECAEPVPRVNVSASNDTEGRDKWAR